MPPGAEPLKGEWKTAKNGKRYFTAFQKEATQYGRASKAGEHLKGGGDQLANFKAAHAAMGVVLSDSVRSRISALLNQYRGDVYYGGDDGGSQSGKDRLLEAVEQACEIAGANRAAELGTEFHQLWELTNAGEHPTVIQPHLVQPLEYYSAKTKPIRFVEAECTVVNDEVLRAGSMDHLMVIPKGAKGPYGEPLPEDWVVGGDGKGLPLDTKIPTPTGWTTMGTIAVGDEVFGSDGRPCRVVTKSSIKQIGTWVVSFDDGTQVVCDTEHLWWTVSGDSDTARECVLPIGEIAATVRDRRGRCQHRVPVAQSLSLPEINLPVDPYLLGAWLGDGDRSSGLITNENELFEILRRDGHKLGVRSVYTDRNAVRHTVYGLKACLREAGILNDKHVPERYLRASHNQRLRLIQGLFDTDGTWSERNRNAVFMNTSKQLALAVEELLLTLGQRPRFYEYVTTGGYAGPTTVYVVQFTPVDIIPFRLSRKALPCQRSTKNVTRSRRRIITAVVPGPDIPTVCIGVNSDNCTYLCTERFVPTHNTGRWDYKYPAGIYAQLATYILGWRYDQETNERLPIHPDLNTEWGVMIHYPLSEAEPDVGFYWINLKVGLEAAKLNNRIGAMAAYFRSVAGAPIPFVLQAQEEVV